MNKMYKTISDLCASRHITISKLATDLNLRQGLFSDLKREESRTLSAVYIEMIADYFGVTTDYIIKGKDAVVSENEGVDELLEDLRNRPGMRMLFSVTRDATEEDILKAVKIIETIRGKDVGND